MNRLLVLILALAGALVARARAGLRVCVICDWLGSFGTGALWATLVPGLLIMALVFICPPLATWLPKLLGS